MKRVVERTIRWSIVGPPRRRARSPSPPFARNFFRAPPMTTWVGGGGWPALIICARGRRAFEPRGGRFSRARSNFFRAAPMTVSDGAKAARRTTQSRWHFQRN
jgi:hypothetical protein